MKRKLLLITTLCSLNVYAESIQIPNYFSATYDAYYEKKNVGYMQRDFYKKGNAYELKSVSDVDGFYGIIPVSDKRVELSKFNIDQSNGVYNSVSYRMDRSGTWLDFVMDIKFDRNKDLVIFNYKDRHEEKPIVGEILDNASYQLKLQQEIINGNKGNIQYDIAYKTGFRDFNFKYIGEETLNINGKNIDTFKYQQVRKNKKGSKKAVYTWFDKGRNNIMVRLLYINDKGKEEARFDIKKYSKK